MVTETKSLSFKEILRLPPGTYLGDAGDKKNDRNEYIFVGKNGDVAVLYDLYNSELLDNVDEYHFDNFCSLDKPAAGKVTKAAMVVRSDGYIGTLLFHKEWLFNGGCHCEEATKLSELKENLFEIWKPWHNIYIEGQAQIYTDKEFKDFVHKHGHQDYIERYNLNIETRKLVTKLIGKFERKTVARTSPAKKSVSQRSRKVAKRR